MTSFLNIISFLFIMILPATHSLVDNNENDILGKWISTEKNLIIEVYKDKKDFRAKVIWFSDPDDPNKTMKMLRDYKNPKKNLRTRKVLGMDILDSLVYNPSSERWEDGIIYDPNSGRHWSSVVYFNKKKQMEVKGYWKFEFISQSITFEKYN